MNSTSCASLCNVQLKTNAHMRGRNQLSKTDNPALITPQQRENMSEAEPR